MDSTFLIGSGSTKPISTASAAMIIRQCASQVIFSTCGELGTAAQTTTSACSATPAL
jgi:hypothetical protein